jgi:hypothetical protein
VESVRGAVPESATSDPGSETARFWRIPAGEIEQLAASRLRQWLLDGQFDQVDPGSHRHMYRGDAFVDVVSPQTMSMQPPPSVSAETGGSLLKLF